MENPRRAVIDVGTNSVKLLVADVNAKHVEPVFEDSEQTRLGRGFYDTHILQAEPITLTADAVGKFSNKAKSLGAESIRIIATSAARDALNSRDLINAIKRASGINVEIISGEQEADWAFQGVISSPELAAHPLLILDVGGGSTEFILGYQGHAHFRESFKLGTVRLFEQLQPGDKPSRNDLENCRQWLSEFLSKNVEPRIRSALAVLSKEDVLLVGSGGTSTILARIERQMEDYDRQKIESTRLTFAKVQATAERLWGIPFSERQAIAGLPPKRADVILTGVAIYEAVMKQFGYAELRVSTRGLRFAAIANS